jgi:hypothetical protein
MQFIALDNRELPSADLGDGGPRRHQPKSWGSIGISR